MNYYTMKNILKKLKVGKKVKYQPVIAVFKHQPAGSKKKLKTIPITVLRKVAAE